VTTKKKKRTKRKPSGAFHGSTVNRTVSKKVVPLRLVPTSRDRQVLNVLYNAVGRAEAGELRSVMVVGETGGDWFYVAWSDAMDTAKRVTAVELMKAGWLGQMFTPR
jgi:hypothetical protein